MSFTDTHSFGPEALFVRGARVRGERIAILPTGASGSPSCIQLPAEGPVPRRLVLDYLVSGVLHSRVWGLVTDSKNEVLYELLAESPASFPRRESALAGLAAPR